MRCWLLLGTVLVALSVAATPAAALAPPRRICQLVVVVPYRPVKVVDGGWVAVGCHRARRMITTALRTHRRHIDGFACSYRAPGDALDDPPAFCSRRGRSPSYGSAVWAE